MRPRYYRDRAIFPGVSEITTRGNARDALGRFAGAVIAGIYVPIREIAKRVARSSRGALAISRANRNPSSEDRPPGVASPTRSTVSGRRQHARFPLGFRGAQARKSSARNLRGGFPTVRVTNDRILPDLFQYPRAIPRQHPGERYGDRIDRYTVPSSTEKPLPSAPRSTAAISP